MTNPKITIGLPVYNGAKYLDDCLSSLLALNYPKFELIISDNGSTDLTYDICQKYANTDTRIKYYRNENNRGSSWNFNHVFELRSNESKYFMWAAHDDLWDSEYVSKCIDELESNPQAVACGCDPFFIDEQGKGVELDVLYNKLDTRGMSINDRVSELTKIINWYSIYSVIKVDALKETKLATENFGSDVILLMELLLKGETLILVDKLFFYRVIKKTSLQQMQDVSPEKAFELSKRGYSSLCLNLIKLINNCEYSFHLRQCLKKDFVYNVSYINIPLRNVIFYENTGICLGIEKNRLVSYFVENVISITDSKYKKKLIISLLVKAFQLLFSCKHILLNIIKHMHINLLMPVLKK